MAKDDSISQSNSDITLRLQIILSRQVHNGMIVAKSCCFTCQRISALATNCQGSLKLVYDSSRQMSLVHCAITQSIYIHLSSNLLEPQLWLGYPDHTIRGSEKIVQNKLVTGLIAPELLSSHLFLKEFT
ncbi:Ubiquitin carboxyl-terminal hydrolase [Trichinella spiralis]|uniref:Ubiquitin carboxyl-terminal hydrolase n=1 Tax=Trichinella spiralis TaxID=6334 RepID=A0ABR3KYX2_TRISP